MAVYVYQCELDNPLGIYRSGYICWGEFWDGHLTNKNEYLIVKDKYGTIKLLMIAKRIIYDLTTPKPFDGGSQGGKVLLYRRPKGIKGYMGRTGSIIFNARM